MGNYRTWAQNADANPLSAQLAERDAKIAALKAQVETREADVRQLQKQLNEAGQIVRAGEAERKALAAQVAELQAWKDAVPMNSLRYVFLNNGIINESAAEAMTLLHTVGLCE